MAKIEVRAQAMPEGTSFAITKSELKRTESGRLLGHFTIAVPPGNGFLMPLTVIASTEREAFAQIAALSKRFEGLNESGIKAKYKQLKQSGWMMSAGIDTKKNAIHVKVPVYNVDRKVVHYATIKVEGADLAAVGMLTRHYASLGDPAAAGKGHKKSPLQMTRDFKEEMGKPGAYDKLVGKINARASGIDMGGHRPDEEITAIKEALAELEIACPGISAKIQDENEEIDGKLHDLTPQILEDKMMNLMDGTQRGNIAAHAKHLGVDHNKPSVLERLFKYRNESPDEIQTAFPVSHTVALSRNEHARSHFGGVVGGGDRKPGEISGVLDSQEFNDVFPEIRENLGGNRDWQDNTMEYHVMMNAFKEKYYDAASQIEKEVIKENVKYLLDKPDMTEADVEAALVKTDDTSANCSFNLFMIAYKHRLNVGQVPMMYPKD